MQTIGCQALRAHLKQTLDGLGTSGAICVTRHGRPVGVLLSIDHHKCLQGSRGFGEALRSWRERHPHGLTDEADDPWRDVRDRRPVRPFEWPEDT